MNKQKRTGKLSLYPLKFEDVIADVLQMKPEPQELKPRLNKAPKQRARVRRRSRQRAVK